MRQLTPKSLRSILIAVGALLCLPTFNARAAAYYFHVNGNPTDYGIVANSTNAWDNGNVIWDTTGTGAPTVTWPATASDAHFNSTITPYTATLNSTQNVTGLFVDTATTVNVNDAGNGTGAISFNTAGDWGVTMVGATLVLNVKITGPGRPCPENGTGTLYLYGTNDYSGGTYWGYNGSPLCYFNNSNSFGSGTIAQGFGSTVVGLIGTGGTTITLPNNFWYSGTGTGGSGSGFNFAAATNTPVVCNGNWNLGTINYPRVIQSSGGTSSPLTMHGVISGAASILYLQANNSSAIYLDGASTYTGKTVLRSGPNGGGITVSVGSNPANLAFNKVSGGSASANLGHPTTVANGTIAIGDATYTSKLIYTGAGETTDRVIDLPGTTGGATLENDGSGPLSFTASAFTATGAGSKTLTLQGSNTGANTISAAIVDNSSANKTSVTKAQAGMWVLGGANTYSGLTTVSAGTLEISGSVAGNVTQTGGLLQLDSPTALGSSAAITVPNTAGSVNLHFTGTQVINSLTIGGTSEPTGTWGSPTSGADHTSNVFTGNGLLNVAGKPVIVTQPQSVAAWPDSSATFTVVATGAPSYQWKRNGVNVGANSSALTINPVEAANAGTYVCWLTNAFGYTNTANATLTVRTTNAYTAIVLGDNPISYWRLDEAGGTIAYDAVGTNNGTYNNVILNKTPGYSSIDPDACVNLQKMPVGQGSFVSVANYQAFNFFTNAFPQFTLEGWAYFTNINGVQRLFSTDQAPFPGGYMFGISGANQLVFTTSAYQDYYMPPTGSLPSPLQANVWYHLAVGCDGNYLYFYVNGQPVGFALLAASHGGTSGAPMCLGANGDFLSSGANDNSEQVKGYLDECAIYGAYLGDAEILAHYNAAQPSVPVAQTPVADQPTNYNTLTTTLTENASGQILHYHWFRNGSPVGSDSSTLPLTNLQTGDAGTYTVHVDNGAGGGTNPPGVVVTVLPIPTTPQQVGLSNALVLHLPFDTNYQDISGHKNNGTNVNATTLNTDTPIIGGGYLHYSSASGGPYNYVTLGKPTDLVFGPAGNFSVAFWVRQSGIYTNLPFFGNATNSIARTSVGFALAPGLSSSTPVVPNGGWAWSFFDGTTSDYANGADLSISDNNWHHLTYVFDRAANATVYLDGVLVSSVNDSYLGGVDSGAVFNIGQDPTGMYDADASADIDDLGVWRRALTQFEVSGMYLAGSHNTPGVSFAPVITAPSSTSVTISNIVNNGNGSVTINYGAGSGSQFILVSSPVVPSAAGQNRDNWTAVKTNSATPGSFTITPSGNTFYSIQSK